MKYNQRFKIPEYCTGKGNVVYQGGGVGLCPWGLCTGDDRVRIPLIAQYLKCKLIFKLLTSIKHVCHDSLSAQSFHYYNIFFDGQ